MECDACRDLMLDVLYGEAAPATKRVVLEHHAACARCHEEFLAFTALRRDLGQWRLPDALRPRRRPSASWGFPHLAAAASLLLALASLVLGASRVSRAERSWQQELARQETRHRDEIRVLRASLPASTTPGSQELALSLNATMHRLVRESEARQAQRLGASLADLQEKSEAQRKYDLAQVSASLAYLEGKTGMQMARTTELMGHVLQASQKR